MKALEEIPEPPSYLVIDDADALDPDDPFGFLSGKSSWYEIHKALRGAPMGWFQTSEVSQVHKRILEVEGLNKPEKDSKTAASLRAIASIREEVMREVMSK